MMSKEFAQKTRCSRLGTSKELNLMNTGRDRMIGLRFQTSARSSVLYRPFLMKAYTQLKVSHSATGGGQLVEGERLPWVACCWRQSDTWSSPQISAASRSLEPPMEGATGLHPVPALARVGLSLSVFLSVRLLS